MRLTICGFILALGLHAQTTPPTRIVQLSWTASTSPGVMGYNVRRCTEPCVMAMSIAPIAFVYSTTATDSTAVVGQTYQYGVTAVAQPCVEPPTQPITTPCGESIPATATVAIQPKPAAVGPLGYNLAMLKRLLGIGNVI